MNAQLLIVLPFLSMPALQACRPAADPAAEAEKLLRTDREFAAFSVKNGAAEAFRKFLVKDALQLPAGKEPVFGRAKIYRDMAPGQDRYELDWNPRQAGVAASGELGWSWGTYSLRYTTAAGKPAEAHGKYVNIWKKQADGNWRVYLDTGNESPAPQ